MRGEIVDDFFEAFFLFRMFSSEDRNKYQNQENKIRRLGLKLSLRVLFSFSPLAFALNHIITKICIRRILT